MKPSSLILFNNFTSLRGNRGADVPKNFHIGKCDNLILPASSSAQHSLRGTLLRYIGYGRTIFYMTIVSLLFISCNNDKNNFDASGSFEAEETIISSEAAGTLLQFKIEEGEKLQAGSVVGYIDSTQLRLKREDRKSVV